MASKTKTSFYRRLYVAYLIDSGVNTVQQLLDATGMPKRTLQDTLAALNELDIKLKAQGGTRALTYSISDWGAIRKSWIKDHLQHITDTL